MREKMRLMFRYCELKYDGKRLSDIPFIFQNDKWVKEVREVLDEMSEIEELVLEAAKEVGMKYDAELNLFVEK